MITEQDLLEAIAECQGERNPNANTCIKLAAYYTILNQLSDSVKPAPKTRRPDDRYSFASSADTEFAKLVEGLPVDKVWGVMGELMDVIKVTNISLYNGVMRRIRKLGEGD